MGRRMKGGMMMTGIALALAFIILPVAAHSAQEKGPIRLGFLSTSSGSFSADGQYLRDGLELYLSKIKYTVAGRKIEVFHEDDKNDAQTGLVKAQRLVEEKKVHMVSGVVPSNIAYAIKDYLAQNKIPFIICNAGADNLTSRDFSPYVFRASFTNSQSGHVFGDWAYKKGHRRLIVLTSDYSAGYEHIGGVAKVFTDAGGVIVDEIYAPIGTMDFAPYLSRISPDKADGVLGFLGGVDSINFVKQYAQYGLKAKVPLFSLGMIMEHLLPEMGDAALGIVDVAPYMPCLNLKTKEHLEFVKAYRDKFGGKWPNFVCEGAYVSAQLIVKAIELAGGNVEDPDDLVKAMEKVDIVAPRGPLKLDKYHNPIQNQYISVLKKSGKEPLLEITETYPNVGQFWKWTPEAYMKMAPYSTMKGKWVTKK